MADPATQFQPSGIQAGYSFSPTEYRPQQINVPSGAGALWAQVGQTALAAAERAGNTLQQSPLNPMVKAKMDAQIAASQQGIEQGNWLTSLPNNVGRYMIGRDAQGNAILQPPSQITDPTLAAQFQQTTGLVPKTGDNKTGDNGGPPAVNNPAAGNQQNTTSTPYGGMEEKNAPSQTTPSGPPTTGDMGKSASTSDDYLLRMRAERKLLGLDTSDAAQEGTPPGMTYTNPATGNVEPLKTEAPSVFAAKGPGQPPPAPNQPPQAQTPAAATQTDQAAMAQWQAQNAHPVMSSQDALAWMKTQTTLAQDATYLPMGGPSGSPAFAFHMKGGGINTVPVSQMIQKGAGANVAAQNTSLILSKTDQSQGGDQGAAGMPSGTGAGAPQPVAPDQSQPQIAQNGPPPAPTGAMPSGTGAGAPQGLPPSGPPPAPGITDVYGNPLSSYTNVASKGGLTPDQLTAQTAPGGPPAQPPAPPPSNTVVAPADQAAIQTRAQSMPKPTGQYNGDPIVPGTNGPYTYYRNDDPSQPYYGRVYTVLPPKAGDYFKQQRWYLGSTGYDTYELPESQMRQYVSDYWTQTGQGPTRDEITHMSNDELKPWAKQAWYNNNMARSPVDQGTNLTLDTIEKSQKNVQQMKDILQTLSDNGYSDLGTADRVNAAAENAGRSLTTNRQGLIYDAGRTVGGALTGAAGNMSPDVAAAIRTLDQKRDEENKLLAANPQLLITPGKGGGQDTPNIHGSAINLEVANIPQSNVLDDVFSGQDVKAKLQNLDALQASSASRYKNLISGAQEQWQRVDPRHAANMSRLDNGQTLTDPGNQFKDHKFPSSMSPEEAVSKAAKSPNYFPTVKSQDLGAFKQNNPGAYFYDEGGNLLRIKPRK